MVRIHREPPVEGPPGGAVAYTHFGARLARPGRFDSCTLYQFVRAGSSTDENSWPTPNRCGFNSRTAHHAGLARRSSPRSITARRGFDSHIPLQIHLAKRRHSITEQCAELLPRTMRVQISLPLPMWGCGPTDEGARLRTLRSEFNSLHPLHIR